MKSPLEPSSPYFAFSREYCVTTWAGVAKLGFIHGPNCFFFCLNLEIGGSRFWWDWFWIPFSLCCCLEVNCFDLKNSFFYFLSQPAYSFPGCLQSLSSYAQCRTPPRRSSDVTSPPSSNDGSPLAQRYLAALKVLWAPAMSSLWTFSLFIWGFPGCSTESAFVHLVERRANCSPSVSRTASSDSSCLPQSKINCCYFGVPESSGGLSDPIFAFLGS